jgi:hypothetical protein
LHSTDVRVGEEPCDVVESLRLEMAVRVHDADHDVLRINAVDQRVPVGDHPLEDAVTLVEDCTLSLAGDLRRTVDDDNASCLFERPGNLASPVARPVVHHDDGVVLVLEPHEGLERLADDELLVVRRHDEHHERARARRGPVSHGRSGRKHEQGDVVERDGRHEVPEPGDVDAEHQRGPGTQMKCPCVITRASTGSASPGQSRRPAAVSTAEP